VAAVLDSGRPAAAAHQLLGRVWQPARTRAGLPNSVTFHDLRHYYASLLIRHNESVRVVQALLGHASAAETLDIYSHLWPDPEDRTRVAVDEVLGAGPAVDSPRRGCPMTTYVQVKPGGADESGCTPGPVVGAPYGTAPAGGHPSRPAVAGRLERSTRRLGRATLERLRRAVARPS
jgi:hypothetical protein